MMEEKQAPPLPPGILAKIEKYGSTGHRPRVYTCGSFDLMNHGTVALLKKVKELIPHSELMVGIYSDQDILNKKGMNVLDEGERLKGVQFCKYVDLIYFPAPWVHDFDFFEENEVDFVTGEINGWDLDLLQNDEDIAEFKVPSKHKSYASFLEGTQSDTMKQLEKGLSLKIYAKSQFNYLKQKIFALPSDHAEDKDPLLIPAPRSFVAPPEPEPPKKGDSFSSDSRGKEAGGPRGADREAESSLAPAKSISRAPSARPAPKTKESKENVMIETQSLEYFDAAKSLLAELTAHDMYLPLHVEKRTGASELIIRILRERNAFYERSIKQGYSRKDLNLSVYDYYKFKVKIWCCSVCKKLS